jgi:bacteriorhodopsin
MAKIKSLIVLLIGFVMPAIMHAQAVAEVASQKVEMADGLRSSGKIYVVVAVLCFILAGIIFYLLRLEKKISRLEQGGNK